MLKKYRNALLEHIRAANLDPREFKTEDGIIDDEDSFRLTFADTDLKFTLRTAFYKGDRVFDYKYSAYERDNPPKFLEGNYPPSWYDFEKSEDVFKAWLTNNVQKYLLDLAEDNEDKLLPDLWAQLDRSEEASADFRKLQNTLFSSEEQSRISATLDDFESKVEEDKILSTEQLKLLHERTEYLIEASRRLGRKDWMTAAAGAFLGFALQAGLTSAAASQLIQYAGEAIRWIAHSPLLLK